MALRDSGQAAADDRISGPAEQGRPALPSLSYVVRRYTKRVKPFLRKSDVWGCVMGAGWQGKETRLRPSVLSTAARLALLQPIPNTRMMQLAPCVVAASSRQAQAMVEASNRIKTLVRKASFI